MRKAPIFLAGACASALLGSPVQAQGAPAAEARAKPEQAAALSANRIEEIVVTATRRDRNIQDVPIAVSALTAAKLAQQQITDVNSLARVIPGTQLRTTLNDLSITASIRGITQLNASINVDPPIGLYVDGVYNVLNAGTNGALTDLERVEVLKGPQGTLFGRNTIGGAISISTQKPIDAFEGYVQADIGNYDARGLVGVVNVPVIPDRLDTRLVYQHRERGGYGTNFTTRTPAGSMNEDYVRGSALLTLSDDWTSLTTGYYDDQRGYAQGFRLAVFPVASPFNALIPTASGNPTDRLTNYVGAGGFYDAYGNIDGRFGLKAYGLTETISGRLADWISVKSITAYSNTKLQQSVDFDGTPYVYLDLKGYPVKGRQFSQELQIYGDAFDRKLSWIAGVYYFSIDGSQISNNIILSALTPAALRTINVTGPEIKNRSKSAFAQITYELLPRLRLTGGVRYVMDDRKMTYRDHKELVSNGAYAGCTLANNPFAATDANCIYVRKADYDYLPFTVGLDYKPVAGALVYASLSKGYRSGAFPLSGPAAVAQSATVTPAQAAIANQANLDAFDPVEPENLLSIELGAKIELFDRRLRLNVAAYTSNYKNIQVNLNLPPACPTCSPITALRNSGSARIRGFEAEMSALLGGLHLDGGISYTDPEYRSGAFVGQPIINVSRFTASATGSYPIDVGGGTLTPTVTYSYRSSVIFYTPTFDAASAAAVSNRRYGLVDGRLSLDLRDLPVTATLYGRNLTRKKYIVSASAFPAPLAFTSNLPGPPRTFGASLRYSF